MSVPGNAEFTNGLGHFYQNLAGQIGTYIHQNIATLSGDEADILSDDMTRITSYANTFYSISDEAVFEASQQYFQQITNATADINAALTHIAETNKIINIAAGVITLAAAIMSKNGGGIVGAIQSLYGSITTPAGQG